MKRKKFPRRSQISIPDLLTKQRIIMPAKQNHPTDFGLSGVYVGLESSPVSVSDTLEH